MSRLFELSGTGMEDHKETRKEYGTDRAQLVYGQRPDGSLVHITEVQRGLACGCICPACNSQLVARTKADHQVPHFAHNTGDACGGGPETVLHLLAKEAFRGNPKLFLPERPTLNERKQVVTRQGQEVETEFLRLEYADPKKIIPDLYVRAMGYDLFVEVAVTHFSDDTKIQRLREHRIPAVEVDLSQSPRNSTRETIADAVLRTAPRQWLYHPGIDAAEAKRRADEQKWRAELAKREAAAQAKHDKRINELINAYRTAPPHNVTDQVPRLAELQAIGLTEHIGIMVAGIACFTVPPAVWQARIVAEVFHDRILGNEICKAVPITRHLEKIGLIRSPFSRVPGRVADEAAVIEPNFAPPWKAVDAYLKHIVEAGVLLPHGYGVVLAPKFAKPWKARTLAEKQRNDVMQAAVQAVDWILAQLPHDERGNMTGDSWLDSIRPEIGITYRAALQSAIEVPKITGEIDAIVEMLEKHGPLPQCAIGLPIAAAIERRRVEMTKQAEDRRAKQVEEANRLRLSRRDRLCLDAEKELSGTELGDFLNSINDDLSGMTPLESAADSEVGLNRARNVLSDLVRQRARQATAEAERKRYQEMITADAERFLPLEYVDAFLNGRDDELGRTSPLLYTKDEVTYRKASQKLSEWRREFGAPFSRT
jgi:hypothetical protein